MRRRRNLVGLGVLLCLVGCGLKHGKDPADPDVRRDAAVRMGHERRSQNAPLLVRMMMEDSDPLVRAQSALALGRLGDADVVDSLVEALGDKHPWVRHDAVESLGRIGDVRAVPALSGLLQGDPDVTVRRRAALALGEIGHGESLTVLVDSLDDPEWQVVQGAHEGLVKLTGQTFPPDAAAWRSWKDGRWEAAGDE